MIKLNYINTAIAYRVSDEIFINKNLKRFDKDFYDYVLKHELSHSGKFAVKDFFLDFFHGGTFKALRFCFRHPGGFLAFVPFKFYKGELLFDLNMIIMYVICVVLIASMLLRTHG